MYSSLTENFTVTQILQFTKINLFDTNKMLQMLLKYMVK